MTVNGGETFVGPRPPPPPSRQQQQKEPTTDDADAEFMGPYPTVEEVLACQFSSWYDAFSNIQPLKHSTGDDDDDDDDGYTFSLPRKNVTIPSVIIEDVPDDDEFREYLLSDGVRLPTDATKLSSCAGMNFVSEDDDGDDHDNSEDDDVWSTSSTSSQGDDDGSKHEQRQKSRKEYRFPQLTKKITDALQKPPFTKVDNSCVPKLNWSSPKDATWVNGGSMQCKTPGDVYLLLKSSDFCLHDVLWKTFQECRDYNDYINKSNNRNTDSDSVAPITKLQLVLRKWCNLHPSMEFRCFVRQHTLIGISQRNHSQHYPHLMKDWTQIRDTIHDFFDDYIQHRYANDHVENYVVDVYVDQKDRVWVIDFNCWSHTTDALLFEWRELVSSTSLTVDQDNLEDDEEPPQMRIVETEQQVRHDPLSSYRAPIDTVDLANMTQGDSKQFEEFMKMCQKPSSSDDEEESDNDD
jgi:hypothetical protein